MNYKSRFWKGFFSVFDLSYFKTKRRKIHIDFKPISFSKKYDFSKVSCEYCLKLKPRKDIVFMAGSDYQMWAANYVCLACINKSTKK